MLNINEVSKAMEGQGRLTVHGMVMKCINMNIREMEHPTWGMKAANIMYDGVTKGVLAQVRKSLALMEGIMIAVDTDPGVQEYPVSGVGAEGVDPDAVVKILVEVIKDVRNTYIR